MERISSSLFCLSLLVYYLPKLFKAKKKIYVKAHMILGSISVLTMVTAMILKLGQADFVKYIGFSMIMIGGEARSGAFNPCFGTLWFCGH